MKVTLFKGFLMLGAFLCFGLMKAQTVTGTVSDANGPLPGASVVVKGTTNGTQTDFDGNYTLNNVGGTATLVFSYVGYKTTEVAVAGKSTINVSLSEDAQALEEVVLVGYGSTTKKEITSAVTVVDAEEFNKGAINDPSQLLQGKVAGLSIYNKGGNPNADATIRLRGISTVGANSQPLVVIDGVIGASLNNVDPSDIASINVLKDGSAAAIYGTRGSSGVILVTTKTGKAGEVRVDYSGQLSTSSVLNTVNVMSAEEFVAAGGTDLGSKTNWTDEVTRAAVTQIHNVAVSGGQDNTTYRFSANVRDAEGILLNSGFDQFNTRASISTRTLNDKLRIDFNTSYTKRNSNFGYNEALRYAVLYNPTAPVFGADAPFQFASDNYGGYFETLGLFDSFNPASIANQNQNYGTRNVFNYNVNLKYDLSDKFNLNMIYGAQSTKNNNKQYNPTTSLFLGNASSPIRKGRAAVYNDEFDSKTFEMYGAYKNSAGKFDYTLTGGYSYQETEFFSSYLELRDFPDTSIDYINALENSYDLLESGLVVANSDASPQEKIIAFFGRLNMTFDNAIFLSASLRREGSTKLGADNRWGLFPSVGLGADLNNYLQLEGVDLFKVRIGYGVTGALPGGNGLSQDVRPLLYDSATGAASTGIPNRDPNPNLQWEEKAETNFGIEFNAGRLTSTLDLYTRDVSDFILERQIEASSSITGANTRFDNAGSLNTKGLELAVNYDVIANDKVNYNTGIVFSTYKSTLDSYIIEQDIRGNLGSPGQNSTNMIRVREGDEIGNIWGPVFSGEVTASGEPIFEDLNGDGQVIADPGQWNNPDADFAVLGNGIPDFELGWTNTVTFGKWDVNAFFRGAFGHSLVNTFRAFYEPRVSSQSSYNYVNTDLAVDGLTAARYSSLYVEKADFLKLDNLSVGYNFDLGENKYVKGMRLTANVQNAFVITNYTGSDPEPALLDGSDPLAPGIERRNNYFSSRTFTLGLNVNF